MRWQGKPRRVTRLLWEDIHGPIPPSLCVCHDCDNPPCCNPAHLFLGTHQANMTDMARKGRVRHGNRRGMNGSKAKLTDDQVREIRALQGTATLEEVGRRYGVSFSTIGMIWRRDTWFHI
jgi:hypothetical protein